jgi:hypothetical protein
VGVPHGWEGGCQWVGSALGVPAPVMCRSHSERGTRKMAGPLVPPRGEEVRPSWRIHASSGSVTASGTGTQTVPVRSPTVAVR